MARCNTEYGSWTIHRIIWAVILIAIVLTSSCSKRVVGTDTKKSSEQSKEQSSSQGQVKKESGSETLKTSEEAKNVVDEKQEQRVTELFDENGKLKQRITELLNSKKTDNSTKRNNLSTTVYQNTDSVFNNTVFRTRTITIKEKSKDVESDKSITGNFSIWGILGVTLILGGLVWLYFYLKK